MFYKSLKIINNNVLNFKQLKEILKENIQKILEKQNYYIKNLLKKE